MKYKSLIFWGVCLALLFLTGCNSSISYDPKMFKPELESCWPCQMYMQTFQAVSTLLKNALNLMCENAMALLKIFLEIWLIMKMWPWVANITPPNIKKDMGIIALTLFKAIIVSLFLLNSQYIYDIVGKIILQTVGGVFLQVSELVLVSPTSVGIKLSNFTGDNGGFTASLIDNLLDISKMSSKFSELEQYFSSIKEMTLPNGTKASITNSDPMFGPLPMQIQNVIWQLYDALWSGMGLVFQLFQTKTFTGFLAAVFLGYALCALLVYLPLSFTDAFLRLGIGIILLPLFMLLWVFPIKMAKGKWTTFVHIVFSAFFDILFNCIYVAFLVGILRVYTREKMPFVFSTDFQSSESGMRESGQYLTMDFIVMTILIFTVFKLSQKVNDITGYFFDQAGNGGSIIKFLDRLKNLAVALGTAVVMAVASGGTNLSGFKKVAEQSKELVKDINNEMHNGDNEDNDSKSSSYSETSKAGQNTPASKQNRYQEKKDANQKTSNTKPDSKGATKK